MAMGLTSADGSFLRNLGKKRKEDERNKKNKENLKAGKYKSAREKMTLENKVRFGADAHEKIVKSHKKSQTKRQQMNELRKTNPTKYKKLKKEERRKANIAAMNSRSSTWD